MNPLLSVDTIRQVLESAGIAAQLRRAGWAEHLSPEQLEAERLAPTYQRYAKAIELGIPQRAWQASLTGGDERLLIQIGRAVVAEHAPAGRAVVTIGEIGVGKTYAAAAVLLELPLPARPPRQRFLSVPDFADALFDDTRKADALEIALAPGLVVLDDLGLEWVPKGGGGYVAAWLERVFCEREAMCAPTMVTTNLAPDQLARRLGPRVVDRLAGPWGRTFIVPGESLRRRIARAPGLVA